MENELRDKALNRLKSAAGHLQAVITMLEDDRYCIDIIKQNQAVQAALRKVDNMLLDNHLHHCVVTAVNGDEAAERERVLSEILEVFKQDR